MELTKYTQEMFNALQIVGGYKICPTGDYSEVKSFPLRCKFDENCKFGTFSSFNMFCSFKNGCNFDRACSFGKSIIFGKYCNFEEDCSFDINCLFYSSCNFNSGCSFGYFCKFHDDCSFGCRCSFGEDCCFGYNCVCEFGTFINLVSCGGFGSRERTTYFFKLTNGDIAVRCGCFTGSIDEWEMQVCKTHKNTYLETAYLALIPAVKAQFKIIDQK